MNGPCKAARPSIDGLDPPLAPNNANRVPIHERVTEGYHSVHMGRRPSTPSSPQYVARGSQGEHLTIFTDSQAAMTRIQSDHPGPDQATATCIELASTPYRQGNTVTARWTPGHRGGDGRRLSRQAAEVPACRGPNPRRPVNPRYPRHSISLAYLKR